MRIKCFSMIKDEGDIVEDWLRHTVDIFGEGNVYVLDNESSDGTEAILDKYRGLIWSQTVKAGIETRAKGQLLTDLMREHRDSCDLLIPLDGDEFIGLQNTWHRDCVLKELASLDTAKYGRFKFSLTYQAIPLVDYQPLPVRSITEFHVMSYEYLGDLRRDAAKTFYTASSFASTDNGNHFGESTQPNIDYTPLWLYHYHARTFIQYQNKILKSAAYYNYWKVHDRATHLRDAYQAYVDGRLLEHFENTQRNVPRHRKLTIASDRLSALDLDTDLPALTASHATPNSQNSC